jgi:hypothetical protein
MLKQSKKGIRTSQPVHVRLEYTPQYREWVRVRKHLLEFPAHFYPQQAAELVDHCGRSAAFRQVWSYVSRLGFARLVSRGRVSEQRRVAVLVLLPGTVRCIELRQQNEMAF